MDIASFVPSDKKHLLCRVNPWLLSTIHITSDLHHTSHWLIVQTFHKCLYAVKHGNMNLYSVFLLHILQSVTVCTDRWLVLSTWLVVFTVPANYLHA